MKSAKKIILTTAIYLLISLGLAVTASGFAEEEMPVNAILFSPNSMARRFNSEINNYYKEFTGESPYSTTVRNDLYLWKDNVHSDDEKTVYANTFKTFTITFYCDSEFHYAEYAVIYADTSSLNKWTNLPILMYAALIDDIERIHYNNTTNLYSWVYNGSLYSYYADSFKATQSKVGFQHTIEMTATTHLTYHREALAPTETSPGRKECWGCLSCDRIFSDSQGYNAIIAPDPIPPINQMTVLYLPKGIQTIEEEALSNLACEAIIIPEGCTTIGERAFLNCKNLLYVRLPASANDIAASAFYGCDNVTVFQVVKSEE